MEDIDKITKTGKDTRINDQKVAARTSKHQASR